jgi:hypothetical protein
VDAARDAYQHGYAVATSLNARMSQLRALTRLVRLASGRERAVRLAELRTLYADFTEGLSLPDLVEAAELLKTG